MTKAKARLSTSTGATEPSPLDGMPIHEVWIKYKKSGCASVRTWLIKRYLHIVRHLAERQHAKLPREVDINDLVQEGFFGLVDAIEAFDPEMGFKFETFCPRRIGGAIVDYLRSIDRIPRGQRERDRKLEAARRGFFARFGRHPDDQELLAALGGEESEARRILKHGRPVRLLSLDRKGAESDSSRETSEIDVLRDESQADPLTQAQKGDLKRLITGRLSRAERLILVLYYYEEMTMKEIGQTLDLSESRVSQMHSSILARLQSQMLHREREFGAA